MATPSSNSEEKYSSYVAPKPHKRVYIACIPCRKRKVRCDLGPVDDPHEPPCVRCRRESKECFFSATRRKRKADGADEELGECDDAVASHLARRTSVRTGGSFDDGYAGSQRTRHSIGSGSISAKPPLEGYGQAQVGPYHQSVQYGAGPPGSRTEIAQDQEVTNETAAALFQSPINTPGDALHLLLKASGESEDLPNHGTSGSTDFKEKLVHGHGPAKKSSLSKAPCGVLRQAGQAANVASVDPAIAGPDQGTPPPSQEALSIWARLRFVRAGWFTAREAMAYIDYYYKYLAPLTPISPPDLRNLRKNPGLLLEEPMLTVTLLTIASRYMKVTGTGSQTRSYMIHERLWQYLQSMITRMFWGQEQFGGGFCGAGARRSKGARSADKGKLRSLGTIESLLLLSDFHPRSMHFPPNDDDEDILAPDEEELKGLSSAEDNALPPGSESTFAGWAEPAVRSDRMSWSLIGFAHALAYELGIFGTYSDGIVSVDGRVKRQGGPLTHHKRADRLERLLYIYMTQACGRFGFPSMHPDHITAHNLATMRDGFTSVDSMMLETQSPEDVVQQYWVEIASINKACNDGLFPSKELTARFVQTGEYIVRLQNLLPTLHSWRERLENSSGLYMNGLALQAVIEQWTNRVGNGDHTSPQSPGSSISSSFSNLYGRNESYIREVIDASRTILQHVVYDLLPNDYLKHAPVRAYFRIVSAAMFLLKTFALGAKRIEVEKSLLLMDQTISALRTSVVDDVHLCLPIADLLEALTSKIRQKFIPFTAQNATNPKQTTENQYLAQQIDSPSQASGGHKVRYVRQPQDTGGEYDASAGTHASLLDSNITVMPPPWGFYNNTVNSYASPQPYLPHYAQQSPQAQQQTPPNTYAANNASTPGSNFGMPSEEDWLTLDLQPLLEGNDLATGPDDNWFGTAFGPETHNNLEVLGKLVNEGWPQQQGGPTGF
ncbi:MAG: hypothetical protein Q9217_003105 [Psora testacea]